MNRFINSKKVFFVMIMTMNLLFLSSCNTEELLNERTNRSEKGNLRVHFLDVGQADSSLVQLPNDETALIDGGNRGDSEFLVDYIKALNIEKIDYLIATHPHEDHIGGLPEVVKAFDIGKIYMPDKTSNTKIFETLLKEIKNKGLKITKAQSGMTILDERDLKFSIIAPNEENYDDTNDYSIVNKLEYKDFSILFTGDAEEQSENEMINSGVDLRADILKVGHHGSHSSSQDKFLDKVSPRFAIISCETGNSYGHPHKEVLERLNKRDINILRTDKDGTVILDSHGKGSIIYTENNKELVRTTANETDKNEKYTDGKIFYIGNKNSKIYHDEDCNSLPNPENRIAFDSKKEAENNEYRPHSTCIK